MPAISFEPRQVTSENSQQPSNKSSEQELKGDATRLLMAEDNPINQRVGKLILQKAGFEVDLASDGKAALEAHRNHPYKLILMDCQMPIMDGFEASRQIRQSELPQPVIVAVTANALAGERDRCLQAGMDDYLSKPFQAEHLISVIRKWIANGRGKA